MSDSRQPLLTHLAIDFVAFAIGLALAFHFRWQTTDLVWSLWLGSFVIGSLTITSIIICEGIQAYRCGQPLINILAAMGVGTIFFSFHFGIFHIVHAAFLNFLFPLSGTESVAVVREIAFEPGNILQCITSTLVANYGWFLIPVIIVQFRDIFSPFFDLFSKAEPTTKTIAEHIRLSAPKLPKEGQNAIDKKLIKPYINVIRMHLLIFVMLFCKALKVNSFIIYTIIYVVCFFPWQTFRKNKKDLIF